VGAAAALCLLAPLALTALGPWTEDDPGAADAELLARLLEAAEVELAGAPVDDEPGEARRPSREELALEVLIADTTTAQDAAGRPGPRSLDADEQRVLLASLGGTSWRETRTLLAVWLEREEGAPPPPDDERDTAVRILGAHGRGRDLRLLTRWAGEGAERIPEERTAAFGRATYEVLLRHEGAIHDVAGAYVLAHRSLLPELLRVLVDLPAGGGMKGLSAVLGKDPGADPLVLGELAVLGRSRRASADDHTCKRVRDLLWEDDRELLLAAIDAAGPLEDPDAVEPLVHLLRHADLEVRRAASIALTELTAQHHGLDVDAWTAWHEGSRAWRRDRMPYLVDDVEYAPPALASRALVELSRRRAHRRELTGLLAAGLRRPEPELAARTCVALGALRSPRSIPLLLGELEAPDAEVRRAAYLALRRVTREDPGPEAEDWRAAGWR
jgi:hypothetical protein